MNNNVAEFIVIYQTCFFFLFLYFTSIYATSNKFVGLSLSLILCLFHKNEKSFCKRRKSILYLFGRWNIDFCKKPYSFYIELIYLIFFSYFFTINIIF